MSGHSHWATTRRQKEVKDAKKGAVFTKLARAITMAAHKGGNPDDNPTLRLAIDKGRGASMPMDNIKRAIERGAGGPGQTSLEEVIYEGYGPAGVAIMVNCVTDNRNRTVAEIRNIFSRFGGNLGEAGSAAYVFGADPASPQFSIPIDEATSEKLTRLVDALEDQDDVQEVFTNAE